VDLQLCRYWYAAEGGNFAEKICRCNHVMVNLWSGDLDCQAIGHISDYQAIGWDGCS